MKHKSKAFTLIELLTVIAIIGILAGIIVPTVGAVRENANKTKTRAMYSQWISALESFRQDYGYIPTFDFPQDEDGEFANVLTGNESGEDRKNPKGIRYYSFSEDSIATDDMDPATEGQIVDAFGNPNIGMAVDADRSGAIEGGELSGVPTDEDKIRASVVFWSESDSGEGFPEVKSWE